MKKSLKPLLCVLVLVMSVSMIMVFSLGGCKPAVSTVEEPVIEEAEVEEVTGEPEEEPEAMVEEPEEKPAEEFLFDDFTYTSTVQFESNGWIVRTKKGWPGIPGADWSTNNVSFHADSEIDGNVFLRMTSTIGTTVSQTQVCYYQRKFLEGTYAARVCFTNEATSGPNGDQIVMSFYAITPYEKPFDPLYSEMDFEYLPNGGWGLPPRTMFTTTWETVQIEPWNAVNQSRNQTADFSGWHFLVIQAGNGVTNYYIDGNLFASHQDPYYPDAPMSINFNLWFIDKGQLQSGETRTYIEEIDWVFHARNVMMTPPDILKQVEALRLQKQYYNDTVPATDPPLDCTCDL